MDHAPIVSRLRAAGCVFAEDEARLLIEAAGSRAELDAMVGRRESGLPLEHILGWAEFAGLRIAVGEGVFVPRHRTEFLAERAIALSADLEQTVLLDLCCGAGAIAAAFVAARPSTEVYAADIDPAAVASARSNLPPSALVVEGDLFRPLPARLRGRVDILVCNTPYVPTEAIATMPPEARLHEARLALDGGDDGLQVQRRVAVEASEWLSRGGHLLVEASAEQAPLSAAIFEGHGLTARVEASEEHDATIVIATRPR
jgi:release factor glutamine methyltransferase